MSKHTPGPWKVQDRGHGFAVMSKALVAFCGQSCCVGVGVSQSIGLKEAKANAQLIARAPEMAEEIRQLRDLVETLVKNDPDEPILDLWRHEARNLLYGREE